MPAPEVLLACARPADVPARDWGELYALLDGEERDRARRLRFDEDRRAYVLAHALLRALVAAQTGLDAHAIRVAHDARGRPFVGCAPELHVSLSRHRAAVACAATRAAPVGVDVEHIAAKPEDAGLIGAFAVMVEPVTAQRFFLQWTALEAFWKACGTGLADGQPRIVCVPRSTSRFDVYLEHRSGSCAGRGAVVNAFDGCSLAVVLRAPIEPQFVLKRTHCASADDLWRLCDPRSVHGRFCAA